ncbi:neuroblast differentiation-associated protein AHNAK [Nematostella vectensis]|uniref:neuroblast differentiation-associated protein AHNAK n=1 Tax=Nematostella vectensis TaxID=45351 RepID=UPI00207756D2|nr:neuroblast differentiation-associated protein AHNAK [Nematostella vectensis]
MAMNCLQQCSVLLSLLVWCGQIHGVQGACTTEILASVFGTLGAVIFAAIVAALIWYFCLRKPGKPKDQDVELDGAEKTSGKYEAGAIIGCPHCKGNFRLPPYSGSMSGPSFRPGSREMAVDVDVPNNNFSGSINGPKGSLQGSGGSLNGPSFDNGGLDADGKIPYIVGPTVDTSIKRAPNGSLGLVVAEEKGFQKPAMFVRNVIPGSPSAEGGVLERGDEVVGINGVNTEDMTHQQAMDLIKSSPGKIDLKIVKNSLDIKGKMKARAPSARLPETKINMPEGDAHISGPNASVPKASKAKGGMSCCSKPKTKGDMNYSYEMEPVEYKGRDLKGPNISPRSHVIDIDGGVKTPEVELPVRQGIENAAFESPDLDASLEGTDVDFRGPSFNGPKGGASFDGPGGSLRGPSFDGPKGGASFGGPDGSLRGPSFDGPKGGVSFNGPDGSLSGPSFDGPKGGASFGGPKGSVQGPDLNIGGGANIKAPKGGASFDGPGGSLSGPSFDGPSGSGGVNVKGPKLSGPSADLDTSVDGADIPYIVGPKKETIVLKDANGALKFLIAKEPGMPSPALFVRKVFAPPSQVGGLEPGDEIVGINGKSIKGKSHEEAMNLIRHTQGHQIDLTIVKNSRDTKANLKWKKPEVDVHTPDAKMSKPKFSCCGSPKTKGEANYSYGVDGDGADNNVKGPEGKVSRPDVNVRGPKGKVPQDDVNVRGPSGSVNNPEGFVDVDIDGPDVHGTNANIKRPNVKGNKKIKGAKVSCCASPKGGDDFDNHYELPKPRGSIDGPDFEVNGPKGDLDGDFDIPSPSRPGINVDGPRFPKVKKQIDATDMSVRGPEIAGPDFDPNIDGPGIKGPGWKGPNIKEPTFEGKAKTPNIKGDVDIEGPDADVDGSSWKFKGPKMPKFGGNGRSPDVDIHGPDFNGDIDSPDIDIKGKIDSPEVNVKGDIDSPDADINGPGWKFKGPKMPKFKGPSFEGKGKSGHIDIEGPDFDGPNVKGDIDTPDINLKGDIDTPDVNVKGDIDGPDADVHGPGWKFKGPKMPKFKGPTFGGKGKSGDIDYDGPDFDGPKVKANVEVPDASIKGPDIDGSAGGGINLPDANIKGPGFKIKGDHDGSSSDSDDDHSHGFSMPKFKMPKFKGPSFGGKGKSGDIDVEGPELKGPKVEGDIDTPDVNVKGDIDTPDFNVKGDIDGPDADINGPSWKFKGPKMPKFKGPSFGGKGKSGDIDIEGPDFDGPNVKGDIDPPDINLKGDIDTPDVNVKGDIDGPDADVHGPGWKFKGPKMPKFKGPSFGGKGKSGDIDYDGPDFDGPKVKANVEVPDASIKGPDIDGSAGGGINLPDANIKGPGFKIKGDHDGSSSDSDDDHSHGFSMPKFKMPKFKGPSFGGKGKSGDIDVEGPELKGPKVEGDIDTPDVNVKGDIDTPDFNVKGDIDGPDADINGPSWKFKGPKMPKFKGPSFGGKGKSGDIDIEGPDFDGPNVKGDIDPPDINLKGDIDTPDVNVKGDIDGPDADVHGPGWKFKGPKMPKFKGPSFGGKGKSGDIDYDGPDFDGPKVKANVEVPDASIKGPDIDGSAGGGINLPDANIKGPGFKIKGDHDGSSSDSDDDHSHGFSMPKFKMPKFKGPSFGGKEKSGDIDVEGPELKGPKVEGDIDTPDVNVKGDIDTPDFNVKGDIDGPDADINGPSWKFKGPKMPKFKGPSFGGKGKSGDIDIEGPDFHGPNVKGDIDTPDINLKGDIDTPDVNVKGDIDGPDADVHGPGWKFKGPKMPKFKGPSFGGKGKSGDIDYDGPDFDGPKVKANVEVPDASIKGPDIDGSAGGGINLPDANIKGPGFKIKGDHDGSSSDSDDDHSHGFSMPKFKMPKFKGPSFGGKGKSGDIDVEGPELKGPKVEGDIDTPDVNVKGDIDTPDFNVKGDIDGPDADINGPSWKFKGPKMPKFKGPSFGGKGKSGDIDIEGPDFHGPNVKGDIDTPDINLKGDIDTPDVNVKGDIDGPDADVHGPGWKFKGPKMPKFKGPSFGGKGKSGDIDYDGPDFDGPKVKANVEVPDASIKGPDIDGSAGGSINLPDANIKGPGFKIKGDHDGSSSDSDGDHSHGFSMPKFKMPKFKGPSFGGKGKSGDIDVEGPELKGPKVEGDIDTPDVNVKGDIDTPDFNVKGDIEGPDADIDSPGWKFKGPKMPKFKGPSFGGKGKSGDIDIEGPDFDGPNVKGDIDTPDINLKGDIDTPDVNVKGDIDGPDADLHGPGWKFKGPKMPKFKGPSFGGKGKSGDIDFDGPDFKSPKLKGEIDTPDINVKGDLDTPDVNVKGDINGPDVDIDGLGWKFKGPKMPNFKSPSFGGKGKTPDVDVHGSDFNGPPVQFDVDVPDTSIKGPDIDGSAGGGINLPDANIKGPGFKIKGDHDGSSSDSDDDHSHGFSMPKLKMPKFKGPSFGGKGKSGDIDVDGPEFKGQKVEGDIDTPDVNVKGDIDTPDVNVKGDIDGPDADINGPGWKFKGPKMPKFKGPSFGGKGKSGDIEVEGPGFKGPKIKGDIDTPDINLKGDIDTPDFNVKGDIDGPDADIDSPGWKFKGPKMPKLKGPSFGGKGKSGDSDYDGPDFDKPKVKANVEVPDASIKGPDIDGSAGGRINLPDANIKGPGLKIKADHEESSSDSDDDHSHGFSMPKFKMPKFKGPSFGGQGKSGDIDVEGPDFKGPKVKGDVDTPDINLKGDIDTPDFNVKGDIDGPDADIDSPGWKFKGPKMPKFKGPSFGGKGKSGDSDYDGPDFDKPKVKANVEVPDASIKGPDIDGSAGGGINLPDANIKGPGLKIKGDHEGSSSDSDDDHSHGFSMPKFKMPKFKGPSFGGQGKSGDIDVEGPDFKGPKVKGDVDTPDINLKGDIDTPDFNVKGDIDGPDADIDSPGWKFKGPKMPKFKGPSFGGKGKSGDIDIKAPDFDGPKVKGDIDTPDINLKGDIDTPDFNVKGDIDGPDADIDSPGWKFKGPKMPKFKGPSFGGKGKSGDIDYDGPDFDKSEVKSNVLVPDASIKGSDIDGSAGGSINLPDANIKGPGFKIKGDHDGSSSDSDDDHSHGFSRPKFKMPKFKGPSFGGQGKPADIDVEGPDFKGPKVKGDVDIPDINLKGPDFDGPNVKGNIDTPNIISTGDIDTPDVNVKGDIDGPDADIHGPGWKFKGPKMPKFKGPSFGGKGKSGDIEVEGPEFKGPKVKGDIDSPDADFKGGIEGPDADVDSRWKFKAPHFHMPSLKGKSKSYKLDHGFPETEDATVKGFVNTPDVGIQGPSIDKPDIKLPSGKIDFEHDTGSTMPDVKGPSFEVKMGTPDVVRGPSVKGPSVTGDMRGPDVGGYIATPDRDDKDNDSWFGLKLPGWLKGSQSPDKPSADASLRGPTVDISGPNLDFEGDANAGFSTPKQTGGVEGPDFNVSGPSFGGGFNISHDHNFNDDIVTVVQTDDLETVAHDTHFDDLQYDGKDLKVKGEATKLKIGARRDRSSSSSSSSDDEIKAPRIKGGLELAKQRHRKSSSSSSDGEKQRRRRRRKSSSGSEGKSKLGFKGPRMPIVEADITAERKSSASSLSGPDGTTKFGVDVEKPKIKGLPKSNSSSSSSSSSSSDEEKRVDVKFPVHEVVTPKIKSSPSPLTVPGKDTSSSSSSSSSSESEDNAKRDTGKKTFRLPSADVSVDPEQIQVVESSVVETLDEDFDKMFGEDPGDRKIVKTKQTVMKVESTKVFPSAGGTVNLKLVPKPDAQSSKHPTSPTSPSNIDSRLWEIVQGYIDQDSILDEDGKPVRRNSGERKARARSLPPRTSPLRPLSSEISLDDDAKDDPWMRHYGRVGDMSRSTEQLDRPKSRSIDRAEKVSPSFVFSKIPHVKGPLSTAERTEPSPQDQQPTSPTSQDRQKIRDLGGAPRRRLHEGMFDLNRERPRPRSTDIEVPRESRKMLWELETAKANKSVDEPKRRSYEPVTGVEMRQKRPGAEARPRPKSTPVSTAFGRNIAPVEVDIPISTTSSTRKDTDSPKIASLSERKKQLSVQLPYLQKPREEETEGQRRLMSQQQRDLERRRQFMESGKPGETRGLTLRERKAQFDKKTDIRPSVDDKVNKTQPQAQPKPRPRTNRPAQPVPARRQSPRVPEASGGHPQKPEPKPRAQSKPAKPTQNVNQADDLDTSAAPLSPDLDRLATDLSLNPSLSADMPLMRELLIGTSTSPFEIDLNASNSNGATRTFTEI